MNHPVTHWNDIEIDYDKVLNGDPSNVALLATAVGTLPRGAADILDLGAGTGRLTALCRAARPDARLVGVDPAPTMVDAARLKFAGDAAVSFEIGTAQDLGQFPEGSFDVVITSFVLHHLELPEYPVVARQILRVLKPGGCFINADQFCRVMGPAGTAERAQDILELLTDKAKYYLRHASFERALLQIDLLPRFLRDDGEILTTADHWREVLTEAGAGAVHVIAVPPVELYNQVIVAVKAGGDQDPDHAPGIGADTYRVAPA